MGIIRVELDDETLAEAVRLSGARTEAEAIEVALRDYVARNRPAPEAERARRAQGWDHDGWRRRRETGTDATRPEPEP